MRRILIVTALMLAGCASGPSHDDSAALAATAAMRQAIDACEREQAASPFTAVKFMACRVAAERNFAVAIHLPNMNAFDTYAAGMLALAADYDAGRIALKRMRPRAASILNAYRRACDCNFMGHRSDGYSYDILPSLNPEHP